MLRSPAQAALSDLSRCARDLAAAYGHARELATTETVRRLFALRLEEQERLAERARAELARLGDLPNEPDPDRQELSRALRRAKAAVSRDEERTLGRELGRREAELEARLEEALGAEDRPPSAEAWLRDELRRTESMRMVLGDLREAD